MMFRTALLAPLALVATLGACGETAETGDAAAIANGEPIEPIAAPAGQQWSDMVRATDDGGYVMGNPDAPIKLVEFMSITCSHCRTFGEQAFATIKEEYVDSGRVSFEIRNFVRDPLDLTAAMLARCGGETPFFALTEEALGNQDAMFTAAQGLGEARYNQIVQLPAEERFVTLGQELGLIDYFGARGVSADQARGCLANTDAAESLMASTQRAVEQHDVQGTPTFLINGQKVDGTSWPVLETKLKEAGAR